tara:strand:+ start:1859 stop:2758 length:900 start_codon:yes stop_codon:yes gene_type:complete
VNAYRKTILPHPTFYIVNFTKNESLPYVLFIHGGPGLNCGILEHLIQNHHLFNSLQCNVILYDQRNCGRSKKTNKLVQHQDNINDLNEIMLYIKNHSHLNIQALVGHSYGAKLLVDYYNKFSSQIPGVFISTANSIITPRLNNLMLDLSYLKKTNPKKYTKYLKKFNQLNADNVWDVSKELAPLFHENKDRHFLYWANIDSYNLVQNIQQHINLPIDTETFDSVREDLYSKKENFSVDINQLKIRKLWINGFHDFVMNGHAGVISKNNGVVTFFKSAHYPHIEESEYFNEILNGFIKGV